MLDSRYWFLVTLLRPAGFGGQAGYWILVTGLRLLVPVPGAWLLGKSVY